MSSAMPTAVISAAAAEDAAHLAGRGQEQRPGDEHADEDREAAEQRRALLREPALLHRVDRADPDARAARRAA